MVRILLLESDIADGMEREREWKKERKGERGKERKRERGKVGKREIEKEIQWLQLKVGIERVR